jgi:hypothetical protein
VRIQLEQLQEKHQEFKHEVTMRISQKNKIIKSLEDKVYTHTHTHTQTHTHKYNQSKKNLKALRTRCRRSRAERQMPLRHTNSHSSHTNISFEPFYSESTRALTLREVSTMREVSTRALPSQNVSRLPQFSDIRRELGR